MTTILGSVSCTIRGVPCRFVLHPNRVWEVERSGPVPDALLDVAMMQLDRIADAYGGPSMGPFGPRELHQAAAFLRGTAYVAPARPGPTGVTY